MGLFTTFFRGKQEKEPSINNQTVDNTAFLSIAGLVSGDDPAVMENVASNVVYIPLQDTLDSQVQRDVVANAVTLQWLELVHILDEGRWLCELDWKADKDDFIFLIDALQSSQKLGLKIDPAWLDENEQVTQWCQILDKKLEGKNACVAAFDIDSDSYLLFIAKNHEIETLKKHAESIGKRIDLGKHM